MGLKYHEDIFTGRWKRHRYYLREDWKGKNISLLRKLRKSIVQVEVSLLFVCKSKRLANYLIEHGNSIIRIDTDQKTKGFLVFLFEKTELLNRNLEKWNIDKDSYLIS